MIWIAREIHGELPPTLGFALPLAYCCPLHFGFVNYCLSMALMLLGFALWLRLGRQGAVGRVRIHLHGVGAHRLGHAIGWALLLIACGSAAPNRRIDLGESWARALPRAVAPCLPLCTPVLLMICAPKHGRSSTDGWLLPFGLQKWLGTLFRDRWIALDLGTAAIFMAVLVAAIFSGGGMRLRFALSLPAFALFATFVAAPESINASGFVNGRIAPYALALLVVAIGMPRASERQRRGLGLAGGAFLVLRLSATNATMALYSSSWNTNLKALDHIRPDSTVVASSLTRNGRSMACSCCA